MAYYVTHNVPDTSVCNDFFAANRPTGTLVDVIVGNPPFIRYQRFNGTTRESGLKSLRWPPRRAIASIVYGFPSTQHDAPRVVLVRRIDNS